MLFCTCNYAQEMKGLPILATKQSPFKLRYFSHDGKVTYYQNRFGNLLLSTNYKVETVIQGDSQTNYLITASEFKKKILVSERSSFHSFLSVSSPYKIYSVDHGTTKYRQIGQGLAPKIHHMDKWASYYDNNENLISFYNLESDIVEMKVKLPDNFDKYFVPEVAMLNADNIFYSAINKKGIQAVFKYNRTTKNSTVFYQEKTAFKKIYLCQNKTGLFLASFPSSESLKPETSSEIYFYKRDENHVDTTLPNLIYNSKGHDLGKIDCTASSSKIFFIKDFTPQSQKKSYDLVEYDHKSKKSIRLSNFNFVTSFVNMDGQIILYYRGKYYLAFGKVELKGDNIEGIQDNVKFN